MYKEKVIIKKLPITQVGQVVNFQMKIPRDALRIVGVELSASHFAIIPPPQPTQPIQQPQPVLSAIQQAAGQPPQAVLSLVQQAMARNNKELAKAKAILFFTASKLMGDLRLQSCEDTNIFYSGNVYFSDANIGYGDYSASALFPPISPTHGGKMDEYIVNTEGETTILKGVFRDRQPQGGNPTMADQLFYKYDVKVYVWYEKPDKAV